MRSANKTPIQLISLLIATIISMVLVFHGVQASIELVSFSAIPQADTILIQWETATEIDNAGFFVKRSTDPGATYEDISGFIPAEGSGVIGAQYQFVDSDVTSGSTYYYILEALDTSQNIELHGPITVTLQDTNTPTSTSTATKTPSKTSKPSKTPTRSTTPTRTKTRTPLPSKTYTPAPPTLTPTFFTDTPTFTSTPSVTPSPTLIDAPELVVVLPSTNTPVPTLEIVTPLPSLTPTQSGIINQVIETGYFLVICTICTLIMLWAIIAIGVFIFLQKRNIT